MEPCTDIRAQAASEGKYLGGFSKFSYLEVDSWRAEALDGLRCDLGPITTKKDALDVFTTFQAVFGRL